MQAAEWGTKKEVNRERGIKKTKWSWWLLFCAGASSCQICYPGSYSEIGVFNIKKISINTLQQINFRAKKIYNFYELWTLQKQLPKFAIYMSSNRRWTLLWWSLFYQQRQISWSIVFQKRKLSWPTFLYTSGAFACTQCLGGTYSTSSGTNLCYVCLQKQKNMDREDISIWEIKWE